MPLSSGERFGPYEILAPLGAGGMGEVYRAKDLKLDREVAIKVLPDAVAQDRDRLARFEREAKALASLNHPHIAQIYGLEESANARALAMELVPGSILTAPQPIDAALNYAQQIAEALEAAHEKGITHRDLKPANIMVTPEGLVKLLDFGLAAVPDRDAPVSGPGANAANSPTLTMAATQAGMILGTAAYMSPEQVRGAAVDKRADIWAFGVVLYELLSGRELFAAATVADTLAAVVKDTPDWSALPAGTPTGVRRLLERCLCKDPKRRLRDIGEARVEIDDCRAGKSSPKLPIARPMRASLGWVVAALLTVALVILWWIRPLAPRLEPYRLTVSAPQNAAFAFGNGQGGEALSPDGLTLAFATSDGLWLKRLDSGEVSKIPGAEHAIYPFWSPDGKSIGCFRQGWLIRVNLASGTVAQLSEVTQGVRGGTWNADGTILFPRTRTLSRVSSAGGPVVEVTTLDEARQETAHWFPYFLPDGDHFLYGVRSLEPSNSGIFIGSLRDRGLRQRVVPVFSNCAFVAEKGGHPAYIIYGEQGRLMAQPVSSAGIKPSGDPTVLAETVGVVPVSSLANFTVGGEGTIIYSSLGEPRVRMVWVDRGGKELEEVMPPDYVVWPRLSPDGTRVSITRYTLGSEYSAGIYDLTRKVFTDLGRGGFPAWLNDGAVIYNKGNTLLKKELGSTQPPTVVGRTRSRVGELMDVSPDSKSLAFADQRGVVVEDLASGAQTVIAESGRTPRFSPSGKWLAYSLNSGGIEVERFPEHDFRVVVASDGAQQPVWRRDAKELFYPRADRRWMSVEVHESGAGISFGAPRELFQFSSTMFTEAAGDGQRFLVLLPEATAQNDRELTVLLNWQMALKR